MTHHHILAITGWEQALSNIVFEDYSFALEKYTSLSVDIFGDNAEVEPGSLTIEKAAEASGYGDGHIAAVGASSLALLLTTCDDGDECHWVSPTWN